MFIVNIYVILCKTLVTVLLASLLASAVVYLLLSSWNDLRVSFCPLASCRSFSKWFNCEFGIVTWLACICCLRLVNSQNKEYWSNKNNYVSGSGLHTNSLADYQLILKCSFVYCCWRKCMLCDFMYSMFLIKCFFVLKNFQWLFDNCILLIISIIVQMANNMHWGEIKLVYDGCLISCEMAHKMYWRYFVWMKKNNYLILQ